MTPEVGRILDKAAGKLGTAKILLESGSWGDAASRSYYAVFHAINALLLSEGRTYSSHAQTIGMFNKDYVQSGRFPREFTRIVTRLFEDRQSSDYDVAVEITEEEARRDVLDAERILAAVTEYLESS